MLEVAHQLSVRDLALFVEIPALEYISFLFHKGPQEAKCEHLEAFTRRFNWICDWVRIQC